MSYNRCTVCKAPGNYTRDREGHVVSFECRNLTQKLLRSGKERDAAYVADDTSA